MLEYQIVTAAEVAALTTAVAALIAQGWHHAGGVSCVVTSSTLTLVSSTATGFLYIQAMSRGT